MSVRGILLAVLVWLASLPSAYAQGFAGLGGDAEGFALPQRGYEIGFPRDHGPHEAFRIEWWYLTANLRDADGTDYGLQWTLFRAPLWPGDEGAVIWMGHAAVTTPEAHYVAERLAAGGTGQAGVVGQPFEAWIDDWHLTGMDTGDMRLRATGTDFAYEMNLTRTGPIVLQGDRGYSVKSPDGRASHYYSLPFLEIAGTLHLPDGAVEVTGHAWIDREWSSQPLAEDQTGWDWFSLVFDDGSRLMGFQLRGAEVFTAGTWIAPDGTAHPLPDGAFAAMPLRHHPVAGREVPVDWEVSVAERGIDVRVEALNPDAWMGVSVPYWEGPVRVSGSHQGRGYLEMTGYR